MFSGTKDELVLLKKNEIDRKIQNNIPFNNDTAFDGTKIPSFSAEAETCVWIHIQSEVIRYLNNYAVPLK